jgi:hypothetical protein
MVQLQNGTTLTYHACTSTSTAGFTSVVAGSQGPEFCVLEKDKIAGVEVISQSNNGYDLKVIVWRKASLHSFPVPHPSINVNIPAVLIIAGYRPAGYRHCRLRGRVAQFAKNQRVSAVPAAVTREFRPHS